MSAHMKTHRIKYIPVFVGKTSYQIPVSEEKKVNSFLKKLDISQTEITVWNEAVPWEKLAKDGIKKFKRSGLVLRGARYREGMSQIKLAQKTGIGQNEISKIENGKRGVGEKVAKKLAKALNFDYKLLLE